MTSTKSATEKTERKKRTYQPSNLSAQDKVQAVLAVWTERCKPAEVCRQMNINWITFNHWQKRAMEGMDRDQILLALGRPVTKSRETKDGLEIEDWIYGQPPSKTIFVRFQGDRVTSVRQFPQ